MSKQLQSRVRACIGEPDADWQTDDECRIFRKEWRTILRKAQPQGGEREYRVVEISKRCRERTAQARSAFKQSC